MLGDVPEFVDIVVFRCELLDADLLTCFVGDADWSGAPGASQHLLWDFPYLGDALC